MAIKIVSGWSNPGGSTHAHIALCNLFNEQGLDCQFFGPHQWHLNRCRGKTLSEFMINSDDVIISHFLIIKPDKCKKHIYSCHETNVAPIKNITNLKDINLIHYVSESQRNWHGVDFPSIVIPNILPNLKKSPLGTGAAGVIGSIDSHKQTHLSIQRALDDGWEKVLVYGGVSQQSYFIDKVVPIFTKNWNVSIMNQCEDKQKMYDSIDCVYHSSKRETFNYIKAECELTGVGYRGVDSADANAEYWDSEKILESWKQIIN